MIIVLCGESSAGKDYIGKYLHETHGFNKLPTYTTREPRNNEKNGVDYWFVNQEQFDALRDREELFGIEAYSGGRFYGTSPETVHQALYGDKANKDYYLILTPSGLRELNRLYPNNDKIFSIYVTANLGVRIIRYVERAGTEKFSFKDLDELHSRANRDYGMFLGIEKEADYVINNSYEEANFELEIEEALFQSGYSFKQLELESTERD